MDILGLTSALFKPVCNKMSIASYKRSVTIDVKAKALITEPFSVFHSITLTLHPIQAKRFPY
jgi:hypothetical protein